MDSAWLPDSGVESSGQSQRSAESARIYEVLVPIDIEVESGWLPRNFGLSLAIKRATPSRIRQLARKEPCLAVELVARSSREPDPKIVLRPSICLAPMCFALRFV